MFKLYFKTNIELRQLLQKAKNHYGGIYFPEYTYETIINLNKIYLQFCLLIGSWGTRFIVLFMQNIRNTKKSIYVTSVNGIRINVTTSERLNSSFKSEIDQTTSIYSFEQFFIPNSMELEGFKIETKCILIETSQNSMVVSQADVYSSVGMTTHIPIHKLSTTYVIVSTNPVKYFSQFAVASINENTMIWITFQMNDTLQIDGKIYRSGETFSIKLNRYETYQIQHTVDLTGTFVQSSLPSAVFSGKIATN